MSAAVDLVRTDIGLGVETRGLTVRFGTTTAIDDLSVTFAPGKIHGLLGRNGSGKSTLAATIAAFRRPSSGSVSVGGRDPYEHAETTSRICLVRESGDLYEQQSAKRSLELAASLRPHWDQDYAEHLISRFGLPVRKKSQKLSRGQKSALGVTLGLASRAPLTIFDESYLGMDAPSRQIFYDELLAEYAVTQRTVIVSTHLIEEVAPLFEEVVVIHRGRLLLQGETDDLRSRGATVVGPAAAVDEFVTGRTVLSEQRLGPTKSATLYGRLGGADQSRAAAQGLTLGPVGLQDLFVRLTSGPDVSTSGARHSASGRNGDHPGQQEGR